MCRERSEKEQCQSANNDLECHYGAVPFAICFRILVRLLLSTTPRGIKHTVDRFATTAGVEAPAYICKLEVSQRICRVIRHRTLVFAAESLCLKVILTLVLREI